MSLSWGRLTGTGAGLYLAMPRVISTQDWVWRAVYEDNIPWLQNLMAEKQLTLTEVNENGESPLMVSSLDYSKQKRRKTRRWLIYFSLPSSGVRSRQLRCYSGRNPRRFLLGKHVLASMTT